MLEAIRAQMLEVADEYLEGYEEALLHIYTLFPGLDLQPCKSYMRVEGGRLVDPIEEVHAGTSRGTFGVDRAEEGATNDARPSAELG